MISIMAEPTKEIDKSEDKGGLGHTEADARDNVRVMQEKAQQAKNETDKLTRDLQEAQIANTQKEEAVTDGKDTKEKIEDITGQ
jgi:hypothetical protein